MTTWAWRKLSTTGDNWIQHPGIAALLCGSSGVARERSYFDTIEHIEQLQRIFGAIPIPSDYLYPFRMVYIPSGYVDATPWTFNRCLETRARPGKIYKILACTNKEEIEKWSKATWGPLLGHIPLSRFEERSRVCRAASLRSGLGISPRISLQTTSTTTTVLEYPTNREIFRALELGEGCLISGYVGHSSSCSSEAFIRSWPDDDTDDRHQARAQVGVRCWTLTWFIRSNAQTHIGLGTDTRQCNRSQIHRPRTLGKNIAHSASIVSCGYFAGRGKLRTTVVSRTGQFVVAEKQIRQCLQPAQLRRDDTSRKKERTQGI